jgi:hypothetical protein
MKLIINDDPVRGPEVEIEEHCSDTFVVINGIAIARLTSTDSSQAGTWVPLERGWAVTSNEDLSRVEITYDSKQVVH